ncbi:MAG: hypothetical protein ACI855_001376 [Myxococcota bacterium]|jgi:hypothetical protein
MARRLGMRPWIVVGVAALALGCPQPDPTFSDSYDQVVVDFRSLQDDFAVLQGDFAALQGDVVVLQGEAEDLSSSLGLANDRIALLEAIVDDTTPEQLHFLGELHTVVDVSTDANTVLFTGRDVRIAAGNQANRGNLYIGDGVVPASSGRHNLVMGSGHSWSTSGSLIVGTGHDVTGDFAFVSGENHVVTGEFVGMLAGRGHTVSGGHAAAVSGEGGMVGGDYAVLVSGRDNEADGAHAVVVSGSGNQSVGQSGVVISGSNSTVEENTVESVIVGGQGHEIQGSTLADEADRNVLIGGSNNVIAAASTEAVVVGGTNNTTDGRDRCVGLATMPTLPGAPDGARGACRVDDEVTFTSPMVSE